MRRFYRSKVFAGYAAAAVLLGAAWVDGVMWRTTFNWRDLRVQHSTLGVRAMFSRGLGGGLPAEVTRDNYWGRYISFKVLPRFEWREGRYETTQVLIPWGGVWLVFLVCGATALRKRWLELKRGGEG